MKSKIIRMGRFSVSVCEDDDGNRWVDIPACKIDDDCDLDDLSKLLSKTYEFISCNRAVTLSEFDDIS